MPDASSQIIDTVLIANRGEIAVRIARTLKAMGVKSVAVYSDSDRGSAHVDAADQAIALGGDSAADSYLQVDAILAAASDSGAQAIIPGYGFLSENADFARRCENAGIAFVGPTPTQLEQFGLKHTARELAEAAGVPLAPGTGLIEDVDTAVEAGNRLGYPVMLKSTAGGGGIGLSRCEDEAELRAAFDQVKRLGQNYFSDAGVFLERFIENARHVEIQIFGDGQGRVAALGERDCSLQRRNQKVIEETPAPHLPATTRDAMMAAARRLGESVNYRSAGTVEFIYDGDRDEFYFLEVNTRLQVEHAITEAVTGVDLVEWMIDTAAGRPPALADFRAEPQGASFEVRIYAEQPAKDFQPSPGTLTEVVFPDNVRVDTWVADGAEVSSHFDPMIAKLIVHGPDRDAALARLATALDATRLSGIATNLDYLRQIVADARFQAGDVATSFLADFAYRPPFMEIVKPGTYTTIQDYPGRTGYWHVGVPPSGPMDDYAFRLGNRIVGNHPAAAGIECTILGPTIVFHVDALIALTGAHTNATVDDTPVDFWTPVTIAAGQTLTVGKADQGCRSYLAVRGGIDVPDYLGSKSTFALAQFGGHAGRPLRAGDMLAVTDARRPNNPTPAPGYTPQAAPAALIPHYADHWEIGVLMGPHGAPDFFTQASVEQFFATDWEVHYNSNRLGVRLNGPKPTFARENGGEAGLHPSNIHDTEYAVGAINFTGDMPVILTRDGPSLGGFVCPVTIAAAELWKVGQVSPGDTIHFVAIGFDEAVARDNALDAACAEFTVPAERDLLPAPAQIETSSPCVLAECAAEGSRPAVTYRQAGDRYILIEYGPIVLDLRFRLRVYLLMQAIEKTPVAGVVELSPGVRSLQVNYDSRRIHQRDLVAALLEVEANLPEVDDLKLPTRVLHLPMAFEDDATLDAVSRYRQSVRDTAPWLPNNVDFIQRINGLQSREQVRDVIYAASYMVMGLGDVYLGAPCAVPVDPRHRLVTSKYNPARTYTAEGTVGIGGVYMCIYGMDSPGGYQLVGRTLPIWNKFGHNRQFEPGEPWLLRFFDQVRYYPVDQAKLAEMRAEFRAGRLHAEISEEIFDFADYRQFLEDNADDIAAFKTRQDAAFAREVEHWHAEADSAPQDTAADTPLAMADDIDGEIVASEVSGNVWKLHVEDGGRVAQGDPLLIVEAMKMEFALDAPVAGIVRALRCAEGTVVSAGDPLLVIAPA
ncbi:urea carboxylase [Salinisphaera aquimarina]|uniref:Urea carboxylase n=1 Tax=Salinisphaera aquimarina TaxID=2094031 RepID=A0ABV7EM77_9GAMM